MFANPVVKRLYILKDGTAGLFVGFEMVTGSTFPFERPKEALDHGIIPTIARATHADLKPVLLEKSLIGFTGILASPVRMMQQARCWLTMRERHTQSLLDERRVKRRSHSPPNHSPRKQIEHYGSFTGTLTQAGQVNLDFGGFLGYTSNITGSFDGSTLRLTFPLQNGGLGSFTFVPATTDEFNTAMQNLQTQVNNVQATASAASAQAATATAQQQALSQANTAVGSDLSALQSSINSLNQSATFDEVFSGYAKDWQQMQNDYQTEVNDSKNGCGDGNYNYGTVQYDAGNVKYDLGNIQYDDGNYDYQKQNIDDGENQIQQEITTLQNDWQALQQAATASGGETNYQQSDIDSAVANGNNAINSANAVVSSAKKQRVTYDNEATNLNNKAQALPATMGC